MENNNKFEVGKTYVNLNEQAGKTIRRMDKDCYVPKEITVTSRSNFVVKAVDDMKNEITIDDDDRKLFMEKVG